MVRFALFDQLYVKIHSGTNEIKHKCCHFILIRFGKFPKTDSSQWFHAFF